MLKKFFLTVCLLCGLSAFAQERDSIVAMLLQEPDEEFEAIKCDRDWEKNLHFATILHVDDRYVMYYRTYSKGVATRLLYCYAESEDGIHWRKPDLGIFEFDNNTNNNIVSDRFNGASFEYRDGVYYMLADRMYDSIDNADIKGLYLLESKDGKEFALKDTIAVPLACDTQNQLLWDRWRKTFKWYLRSWSLPINAQLVSNHNKARNRTVSYCETQGPDVFQIYDQYLSKTAQPTKTVTLKEELPVIIRNVKQEDYDIYTPCVHQYKKDLFVAYPTYYFHFPDIEHGGVKDNDGRGQVAMWVSTDGEHFFELKDDYLTNGENWSEFCIGHVETEAYYIHYYITFDHPHAGPGKVNAIKGRIHYKQQ